MGAVSRSEAWRRGTEQGACRSPWRPAALAERTFSKQTQVSFDDSEREGKRLHQVMYGSAESLHCIPESNITLYID